MGADLWEDDDSIHAVKGRDNGGALPLGNQGPSRTLEFSNRTVAIEADDKEIAKFSGALQVPYVAEVQQVKAAVGGNDRLTAAARGGGPSGGLPER